MIEGIEASLDAINQRIIYILKTSHWSDQITNELKGLEKAMDILFELRDNVLKA